MNTVDVFLGGACNPTTWRKDVAIPFLEKQGISFYNPQIDEWHEGLIKLENDAKAGAEVILFVINNQTRGIATLVEVTELIMKGRRVVLVVDLLEEDGKYSAEEVKDINRGRKYLIDLAKRNNVRVFENLDEALNEVAGDFDNT